MNSTNTKMLLVNFYKIEDIVFHPDLKDRGLQPWQNSKLRAMLWTQT